MSLKVAIVGCGKIADAHAEELQKMPARARLVAACDLELLMAEQLATRYAIPAIYSDVSVMLERERPDVVHITTPPQSHLPLALAAMQAGAHVFVEKPLAPSHAESQQLLERATAMGRKVTIGYTYLFDPAFEQARAILREGTLGEVVHLDSIYGYNLAGPFGAAILGDPGHWVHRLPGKLFQNNIDHALNKICEFMPLDVPVDIHADAFVRRAARFGDVRDEMQDELRVHLRAGSTTAAILFSSHIRPVGHLLRIHGTKATLEVDFSTRTVTPVEGVTLPSAIGRLVPPFKQAKRYCGAGLSNLNAFRRKRYHFFDGLNTLLTRYYDAILEDRELPISYDSMLWIAACMDEIFRQVSPGAKRSCAHS